MSGQQDYAAKEAEYRGHAEKLQEMAEQSRDAVERATLLRIADAWLQLASRMQELRDAGK